jgi:predicted secreted Zn-dependent protease
MERHQRIQLKTTSRSIDQPFQVSPFQKRDFGVQKKAASTPASKAELWENYQRSSQMTQHGAGQTRSPIQAKLSIGQPGDKYEQEADSVADRVMSMSAPAQVQREESPAEEEELQMKPLAGSISPLVQRDALPEEEEEVQMKPEDNAIQRDALPEEEEEVQMKSVDNSIQRDAMPEEEEEVQMKSVDNSIQREAMPEEEEEVQTKQSPAANTPIPTPSLEHRLSSSKGGGNPLSDDVRSFMEPRFGADFSGVRVHTGSDAVQMNRDVNAQAFAHGSDIYFGAGKAPGKDALTAHELTHVVQQTGGNSFGQTSPIHRQKKSSPKPPTQTNFTVHNKTYTIEATTLQEVADQISQREEAGETTWNPQFTLAFGENGNATNVTVNVPISVTLPNWPGAAKLSRAAKAEWDRAFRVLKAHEERHVQLARNKLKDVAKSLVGKSQSEAETIFADAVAELQTSSDEYDANSDHGRNEGTNIDTSIGAPPSVQSN